MATQKEPGTFERRLKSKPHYFSGQRFGFYGLDSALKLREV